MANQDDLQKEEASVVKDWQAELERITKEKDEYLDGWRRAKADLLNYKKEEAKRFTEVIRLSHEEIIKDLLPVLDSFELALSALAGKTGGMVEKGVYLVKSQLEEVLKKRGLERIKVNKGDKFDPNFHEAVGLVEGDGAAGSIAEEVEAGYLLYEKVLRPVRVKLFK